MHPPNKERRGKETCLTIHDVLPLDVRPIPRPIRWIICQSLARGAHSSSGITERVRRPHQIQVRTAAPPSAYDSHNNRLAQQLRVSIRPDIVKVESFFWRRNSQTRAAE